MTYVRMADAAFAANIPPGYDIAAGYYPGRDDYHPWAPSDWGLFPGYRLPITVPAFSNPATEGAAALAYLRSIGVPEGSYTVADMETRVLAEELLDFAAQVQQGYKVWTYGSYSTVFGNPQLNGYWVADYTSDMGVIDGLLQHPGVRGVQFASNPLWDSSLVKAWTEGEMWHG